MIYKYTLNPYQPTQIAVNSGYLILDIQRQDSNICVWIDTPTSQPTQTITVVPVMTGSEVPNTCGCYFATIQTKDGLVVHYYV